jgi:hypothetical protein
MMSYEFFNFIEIIYKMFNNFKAPWAFHLNPSLNIVRLIHSILRLESKNVYIFF